MADEVLTPVVTNGLFAAAGIIATSVFQYLGKRSQGKAYTMGAVDHAVQTAMESVTGQLERTEKRLGTMEDQHAECERNLGDMNRRLDDSERERSALKSEIDRLLSGPIAGYTPNIVGGER